MVFPSFFTSWGRKWRYAAGHGTPVIAMQETLRVRRLTPVECERLQGFPESHTLIPYDKRPRMAPDDLEYVRVHVSGISDEDAYRLASDAVRYRALGNSMAVPVMRWIGEQIGCAVAAVAKQAVLIADQKESPEQAASDGIVQVVSFSGGQTPIAKTRPFLKWAGGKYKYLDVIASYLPEWNCLIEPGAGSVFMNMRFKEYLLADVNSDLINLYRQLEETPNTVINAAVSWWKTV